MIKHIAAIGQITTNNKHLSDCLVVSHAALLHHNVKLNTFGQLLLKTDNMNWSIFQHINIIVYIDPEIRLALDVLWLSLIYAGLLAICMAVQPAFTIGLLGRFLSR